LAHGAFVLGVAKRVRARPDRGSGPLQGPQMRPGHVLVVERHDVAAAAEGGQVVQRAVVADLRARAALSSGPAASTRNPMPRLTAAWQVIRASCPAPTMPTTGGRERAGAGAVTSSRAVSCSVMAKAGYTLA